MAKQSRAGLALLLGLGLSAPWWGEEGGWRRSVLRRQSILGVSRAGQTLPRSDVNPQGLEGLDECAE